VSRAKELSPRPRHSDPPSSELTTRTAGDLEELAGVIDEALPATRDRIAALRGLQVPPQDAATRSEYMSLSDRMLTLTIREGRAAHDGDLNELLQLDGLVTQAQARRTEVAADLGLLECGRWRCGPLM
jgi:hypothetical protein